MNAIEIEGLCKHYPAFSMQNLTLTLPSGYILGLVGENGAGKSTLFRLLLNAAKRDAGTIRLLGVDNTAPEFTACKQEIGVVLDKPGYPTMFTARELGGVLRNVYRNWDGDYYRALLARFALPETKTRISQYSKGMAMKLAIAAAMAHRPKLLLLDEPTSGLDPMARDDFMELLRDFVQDEAHTVLLSSHIVSDLEKACDYIAFLHRGQLRLFDEKDRILEEYGLVHLSVQDAAALPPSAVVGRRETVYGVDALVRRGAVNPAFRPETATLEEIILFLAKEGN